MLSTHGANPGGLPLVAERGPQQNTASGAARGALMPRHKCAKPTLLARPRSPRGIVYWP